MKTLKIISTETIQLLNIGDIICGPPKETEIAKVFLRLPRTIL